MKGIILAGVLLFSIGTVYCQNESDAKLDTSDIVMDDIGKAYVTLMKNGNYEEKKKAVAIFKPEAQSERVRNMIVNLLVYNYDNVNFKENDQVLFYDDVIAEELVKILGKNGNSKNFPALLRIALNSERHRDQTVKEAWKAIETLKW